MRNLKTWMVIGFFGLGWSGCNSPTLPLPPPSERDIEAKMAAGGDVARITGVPESVEPYALVTCFNHRTGAGVVGLASANGSFNIQVPATQGDVIEVWQRIGNTPPSVVIQVQQ